jgi:hypothetical protein
LTDDALLQSTQISGNVRQLRHGAMLHNARQGAFQ